MADEPRQPRPRRKAEPEGALPKDQQWTVTFLNDAVRREYKDLSPDLKAAFWELHNKIKSYGLPVLTRKEAERLVGTKDLWELRFRGKSGIGRGLYVQRRGRHITILVFFAKKSDKLPKRILDLAAERRKTLEEGIVEALNEGKMEAKLIDAQDVYDEEYPPGTEKREQMDAMLQASLAKFGRRLQRRERLKALPRKTKEAVVAKLRWRKRAGAVRHAAS